MKVKCLSCIAPQKTLTTGNIKEMYDSADRVIGHSVGYFENGIACGYVILDFTVPGIIAEYTIAANAPDIYKKILENGDSKFTNGSLSADIKFYHAEPFVYNVVNTNSNHDGSTDNYGEKRTYKEFEEYKDNTRANIPSSSDNSDIYDPSANADEMRYISLAYQHFARTRGFSWHGATVPSY